MTKQKELHPDSVLKAYWRNNDRFADLFNQVFFNGANRIRAEDLSDLDTDESNVILDHSKVQSVTRVRDLVKKFAPGIKLAILGLENQLAIHFAMPVRNMFQESLRYTQECKEIAQEHRKAMDLNTSEEMLSGMKLSDRITPTLTLVIYYGEKPWTGPNCLWDMMDIPDNFKPFINNYHIHVFQAGGSHPYSFSNPDNQDFFMLISELYHLEGRFKISDFENRHPGMTVYWETLAAVGAVTGTKSLTNYALKHRGGRLNMCTALQGLVDQGHKEGLVEGQRQGMEKAVLETVRILKEFNIPENVIAAKLQSNFQLPKEELPKYLS